MSTQPPLRLMKKFLKAERSQKGRNNRPFNTTSAEHDDVKTITLCRSLSYTLSKMSSLTPYIGFYVKKVKMSKNACKWTQKEKDVVAVLVHLTNSASAKD